MAAVTKFARSAVVNQLRHNAREIRNPANRDIDPARTHLNYSLLDRGMSPYEYYKQRMSQVHCMDRADVKTMFGWVITAPRDLDEDLHEKFFRCSCDFIADRYGEENIVQCVVHRDESREGRSHLHVCAIPVVPDDRRGGEKVCASQVITRLDLKTFHWDLEEYLVERGIEAHVRTGITAEQGRNRTVRELKEERDRERELRERAERDADEDRTEESKEPGSRWGHIADERERNSGSRWGNSQDRRSAEWETSGDDRPSRWENARTEYSRDR